MRGTLRSGNDPEMLPQVAGWNLGATSFCWLWAFAHRLPAVGTVLLLANLLWAWVPWIWAISLAGAMYLGAKGSELAWRNRPFHSLEHFHLTQDAWHRWAYIGLPFFSLLIAFVGALLGAAVMTSLLALTGWSDLYDLARYLLQR